VGATLIAASVVVLVIGMAWLNRSDKPSEPLATPTVDGVTLPTDSDGNTVDVPPSQPAVAVSFGGNGEILRPDPVRARVIDDSGAEILVPLAPNTTVDTVTGAIVPKSPGTTAGSGTGGTTGTTRRTTTTGGSTAPTTPTPTTATTQATTTTTEATTTTTEATTTTDTTEPPPPTDPPDPPLGLLDGLLP
jgi:hypothetical protein